VHNELNVPTKYVIAAFGVLADVLAQRLLRTFLFRPAAGQAALNAAAAEKTHRAIEQSAR
jgi:hypothetical protein